MQLSERHLSDYRLQLQCNFSEVDELFAGCVQQVFDLAGGQGVDAYLQGGSTIAQTGRGVQPVLDYLQHMPTVVGRLGVKSLGVVADTVWQISRSPNGKSIPEFMRCLPAVVTHFSKWKELPEYCAQVLDFMHRTSSSIHGNQNATIASPSLTLLLQEMPDLLAELDQQGLGRWIEYGVVNYSKHPDRQQAYFKRDSPDSRAVFQRERSGTLCEDHRRALEAYLKALWQRDDQLVAFPVSKQGRQDDAQPEAYFDEFGMRVPDVFYDAHGVSGVDRYRALLAHMAAHQRWSIAIVADNFSPFQRFAIEVFEDSRVEWLAMQVYPGLRKLWMSLHPEPDELACPESLSSIRLRLAVFSRAVLDPQHSYTDPVLLEFLDRFHQTMREQGDTRAMANLAIQYIARTRRQQDLSAQVYFKDTAVTYRDDNRHLWLFIEPNDEAEDYQSSDSRASTEELQSLPPRLYPEWDYLSGSYKPEWVSVYERLHSSGDAAMIDAMLQRNQGVAKQLKQLLDLLKPQFTVRQRYQENGSELDLDVALRSLIDLKSGCQPDPRINMSHRHDGRNIAVVLLLDLSQSLNDTPPSSDQSLLSLSQEAVALLAWAVDLLGDELAIAGFNSDTRHRVQYQHIKGFSERWDDQVKGRLASVQAEYSTRMGAAMRHAAHTLSTREADKKLLLVLTDGEPHDIDEADPEVLKVDAHKAVQELGQKGIYSYCVNLDPQADDYVQSIFGSHYTVIDQVQTLPQKLAKLFVSLTK